MLEVDFFSGIASFCENSMISLVFTIALIGLFTFLWGLDNIILLDLVKRLLDSLSFFLGTSISGSRSKVVHKLGMADS